jgi:predicted Zn-dependent protease with MMP-like domain/Flp pilus assembly protein TadD
MRSPYLPSHALRRGDDAVSPAPPDAEILADEAADAFEAGDFEEALRRSEAALAADARSVAALHCRAAALAELGRLEAAREAYERALDTGKDDVELLLDAADFHVNVAGGDESDRDLLERGLALARRGAKLARKAGEVELAGELAFVEGVALNGLGLSTDALAALGRAEETLPESAAVKVEKGFALYELCRFEDARRVLLEAEALEPEDPWTEHTLGLVAERAGDPDEARRRFARARKLDPEGFPKPIALTADAFDEAVEAALASMPEPVRRYLANVAITVEDLPSEDDLLASDPPLSPAILGLFRGAPYGQKASMDPWSHFPSSILLYQRNLERFARTKEELIEQIGVTLVHEVGHFLGLDEDELWERGLE